MKICEFMKMESIYEDETIDEYLTSLRLHKPAQPIISDSLESGKRDKKMNASRLLANVVDPYRGSYPLDLQAV